MTNIRPHESASAHAPLQGMRVVEFGHVAAGPYAAMLLADLGADVVKVEGPQGDQMRGWPPLETTPAGGEFSHNFASVNRGKRSAQLDLKSAPGRDAAASLVASANVVIENHRSGSMKRFGLDFETVSQNHPGLVYCSISGYGANSPHAHMGAYDVVIQGQSGLMSVTGSTEGPPAKCGVPVADFIAGLYASYTITAMYRHSQLTGESIYIDCPMLDCLLAASALQTSEYWGSGREPRRLGTQHPRNAPYQAFEATDATFILAAGSDQLWQEVCEELDRLDLPSDARFARQSDRARNQGELEQILSPIFKQCTAGEWIERFGRRGIPCGPLNTFGDILSSGHVRATGLVDLLPSEVGAIKTITYPAKINGTRLHSKSGAPRLGEHTDAVLHEWTS